MRLASYTHGGVRGLGVYTSAGVTDVVAIARSVGIVLDSGRDWSLMRQLLDAGPDALHRLADAVSEADSTSDQISLENIELAAPVPDPAKIICVGLNWIDHAAEVEMVLPESPTLFTKFATSLLPDGAPLAKPRQTQQLDYEAELAVVIGTECRNVDAADAFGYIAGYACFNDASARDLQLATSQWLPGKALDGFAPCGPCLVTRDEVADPSNLRITATVNDKMVQDDTTANMIFPIPAIIAHLSSLLTLCPGDIIATGTPPGVGMATGSYLSVGDVVRIEIERVGTLTTQIVQPA